MSRYRTDVIAWACGTIGGFLFGMLILAVGRIA